MGSSGIQALPAAMQKVLASGMAKADTEGTGKTGFGSVLNQSIQSKVNQSDSGQKSQTNVNPVMPKSDKKDVRTEKAGEVKQPQKDLKTDAKKSPKNDAEVTEDVIQAVGSQLMQACDDLKQVLKEQLGITEEQLEEALETLGMTMIDLFDQSNLTSFFLQINGENDMSALLTDENLAGSLQMLNEEMETINPLQDLQLKPEEAKAIFETFVKEQAVESEPVIETVNQVSEQEDEHESVTDEIPEEEVQESPVKEIAPQKIEKTDTETEHDTRQQPKKETVTKEVNIMVNGNTQVTTETKVQFMDQLAPTSEAKEIVQQIVKEVRVHLSPEQTSMEMTLTPETLGKVNLTVTAKDGMMTAHMITESQTAKEAIESQINMLKETLDQQGLKVDAVEVTVAANNFDFLNQSGMNQNNQENSNGTKRSDGKLRMVDDPDAEDLEAEEKEQINASIGKGTQIDLTA